MDGGIEDSVAASVTSEGESGASWSRDSARVPDSDGRQFHVRQDSVAWKCPTCAAAQKSLNLMQPPIAYSSLVGDAPCLASRLPNIHRISTPI